MFDNEDRKERRIIRRNRLKEKLEVSSSTISNWQQVDGRWYDPTFPKAIQLGKNSIGHFEDEIDAWLANRAAVSGRRGKHD